VSGQRSTTPDDTSGNGLAHPSNGHRKSLCLKRFASRSRFACWQQRLRSVRPWLSFPTY